MTSWHSYPSIFNVGHAQVEELVRTCALNVEEKIDGSQFSWGVDEAGVLRCRSKGKELDPEHLVEKLFAAAVATAKVLAPDLRPGWTYRAEYLSRPGHGHLKYARIPRQHLILFDVNTGEESYLSYAEKAAEAARLGLEVVPCLWSGTSPTLAQFDGWLAAESVLGGPKIEGVVLKPARYDLFGRDHKVLMAKHVSPVYREEQKKTWRCANPTAGDIVQTLGARFSTEARWRKAVQRGREDGWLEQSPRDIGRLLKEIPADIEKEAADEIKAALFAHFWPQVRRVAVMGVPEWYKRTLAETAFCPAEKTSDEPAR